mmetsp:Transcript_80820/g.224902  ORF Transcript_80820/g.224902 Transcript_80820/m.224902 type:complete len:233 (+) Transcript_80820:667-1365(+)
MLLRRPPRLGAAMVKRRLFSAGRLSMSMQAPAQQPETQKADARRKMRRRAKPNHRHSDVSIGPHVTMAPTSAPLKPMTPGRPSGPAQSITMAKLTARLPPERPARPLTTSSSKNPLTAYVAAKHVADQAKQSKSTGRRPMASEMRPATGPPRNCAQLKAESTRPKAAASRPNSSMQKKEKTGIVSEAPKISRARTRNKPHKGPAVMTAQLPRTAWTCSSSIDGGVSGPGALH